MTEVEPTIVTSGLSREESPVVGSSSVEGAAADRALADGPLVDDPPADGPPADRPLSDRPLADRPPEQSAAAEGAVMQAVAVEASGPELERSDTPEAFAAGEGSGSAVAMAPESEIATGDRGAAAVTPDSGDAIVAAAAPVRSLRSLIESELVSLDRYHRLLLASGEA